MAEPQPRTAPGLVGDALHETRAFLSKEIAYLRAEMAEGLRHLILALSLSWPLGAPWPER